MPIPKNFNPAKIINSSPKDKLPKKMWKLLDVAIADVKSVFASKNVSINLGSWYSYQGASECTVCLGGSVLLGTLKCSDVVVNSNSADPDELLNNNVISENDKNAIYALDNIRLGEYDPAFESLGYDPYDPSSKIPIAKVETFRCAIKTKKTKDTILKPS